MTSKTSSAIGTILSYSRSINPGIGVFYNWFGQDRKTPVEVKRRGQIGSFSHFIKDGKKTNKDGSTEQAKSIDKGNPSAGDVCFSDVNAQGFIFEFPLSVVPESLAPQSSNSKEATALLTGLTEAFKDIDGYLALATSYVSSLLSGRFLWRNRLAENKRITVRVMGVDAPILNDVAIDNLFEHTRLLSLSELAERSGSPLSVFNEFTRLFAQGLSEAPVTFQVSLKAEYPGGMEIYPSQEYLGEFGEAQAKRSMGLREEPLGRQLFTLTAHDADGNQIRHAAMHPQKIGNAIRTIDAWHSGIEQFGVNPVEVYGFSRRYGVALRSGSATTNENCLNTGVSFYSLLNRESLNEMTGTLSQGHVSPDIAFFVACLVRGGLFGEPKNDPKDK